MNTLIIIVGVLIVLYYFYTINENNKTIEITSMIGELKDEDESDIVSSKKNKLTKLFNDISSADKVSLKNVTEKWSMNKDTMEVQLNEKMTDIIKIVISKIGGISSKEFYVKEIDNMYVMKDDDGNYRCILNCFIYDVKGYYTNKLIMDIVSIDGTIYLNFIDIDESSSNNILNTYDIRWDSQGILADYDMFDENVQVRLDNYYNSKYKILYLDNETIDKDLSGTYTLDQLVQFHLPANIPNEDSPMFCDKYSDTWDKDGVSDIINNCLYNNRSSSPYPNTPYNAPGVISQRSDENVYAWIKDPARGNLPIS